MRKHRVQILCGILAALATGVVALLHDTRPIGVVVITLDTTRADRLSPYGFMDASMPALERLAREGVVFDRATSVAPLTLPAHTSLFTGLFPPRHAVRENSDPALGGDHTTLAEILSSRGFHTGAFVGSAVLDADRGLAQGFEIYRGAVSFKEAPQLQRRANEVITDATRWLDQVAGSPYFLWVHLYDAHRPYDPPEPYRSTIADPYTGELLFVDSQIARLIDQLEQRKILDRTIVAVAADHGESLGDHGERDHGIFLYDSVVRVPLIIRAPGLSPRRVAEVVRLTDVMPTMLEMLDLPPPQMDGVSLVGLMTGRRAHLNLDGYSESLYPQRFGWSSLRALNDGRFKVIDAPRPELYDLERDPFERENIYDQRRETAAALHGRLRAMKAERATSQPVSGNVRERLASLGYVGSSPVSAIGSANPAVDPKDCIGVQHSEAATAPPECGKYRPHRDSIETPHIPQD
jgi:arylsulfatase A-like enzyme